MENRDRGNFGGEAGGAGERALSDLILLAIAAALFLGCILSPPSLMDDVDAVQAQIARNMLSSGDWVTARLDGVPYLEKAPLHFWLIALFFSFLGVRDWVARIPFALSAILLAWITTRFGRWAFGHRAGSYAGTVLATCVGLFLFTRILIPDVMLTLLIALGMWAFLRALEDDELHPARWAHVFWASLGAGILLKGLIALALPGGAAFFYLLVTRQLFAARAWRRLRVYSGLLVMLAIAAPWHILATLRNPPYFDFTLHSGPGEYRGFFWFYFINEQVLRFLNLRYPRDYNTVPRLWFWLLNLAWLFPWSAFAPATLRLSYHPLDRAGRTRLLALCWAGFLMLFFTFSTTQEYYSMPMYPALALLLGSAMAEESVWLDRGRKLIAFLAAAGAAATISLYIAVRGIPTPGDISRALAQHPEMYTLSLGHMGDLTLRSFAYLRTPLLVAALACLIGAIGAWRLRGHRAILAVAVMMVIFAQAARLAMVAFDPYLSSRPLAEALFRSPEGKLVLTGHYYPFSSVAFYTNRSALLWNGRKENLEYGSYAPGAANVFIGDSDLVRRWAEPARVYLATDVALLPRVEELVGRPAVYKIAESGGKVLLSNLPPGVHQVALPPQVLRAEAWRRFAWR